MKEEQARELEKQQTAQDIYQKLWESANEELEKARQGWHHLQARLAEAKMMEFAASGDGEILLPEEELLLDEMNQKLEAAQSTVSFWSRRVEKLRQYRDKVKYFHARLESDIEMHRLRLDLTRSLLNDEWPAGNAGNGHRRVRLP